MTAGTQSPPDFGPDPAWIESQRQAALRALAAAQQALRCGQVETARTKLLLVETHLHAMAAEAGHE